VESAGGPVLDIMVLVYKESTLSHVMAAICSGVVRRDPFTLKTRSSQLTRPIKMYHSPESCQFFGHSSTSNIRLVYIVLAWSSKDLLRWTVSIGGG